MKAILSTIFSIVIFAGCARPQTDAKIFPGSKDKPGANEAVATFAEGCFWHTEIVFQSLVGVRDAVSGYAGGADTSPDYEKVSGGGTGHAESVQVYYDPSKISFETLVKVFFASHDPTQVNRQGNDVGTQYRSIAFYRNEKEKQIIEAEIRRVADSKKYAGKIVTEVKPYAKFYPAEDYHQDFIAHNPNQGYVQAVSIPEIREFQKEYPQLIKPDHKF